MKVRIEIEWSQLIQLVGVGRAKGICRAGRARLMDEDAPNLIPPWEKEERSRSNWNDPDDPPL